MPPCCHPVRERRNGFNCGEYHPDSGVSFSGFVAPHESMFPWTDKGRIGNWKNPVCAAFGPYAPDSLWITYYKGERYSDPRSDGFQLWPVSACVYRSDVLTRGVVAHGSTTITGTRTYYYELNFSGEGAGNVTLTDVTLSHPDAGYPAEVVWVNKEPLADFDVLTLEHSTQTQDEARLLPWLESSYFPANQEVASSFESLSHGNPNFDPGGQLSAIYGSDNLNRDPHYWGVRNGHIPCAWMIRPGSTSVKLCAEATISGLSRFVTGNVESTYSVSGDLGDGVTLTSGLTAAHGGGGDTAYNASAAGDLNFSSDVEAGSSEWDTAGTLWGEFEIAWNATATGVDVTVTATVRPDRYRAGAQTVVWEFLDQPYDWWQSTLNGTTSYEATQYAGDPVTRTASLNLQLRDCSEYHYHQNITPCLEQPIYAATSFEAGVTETQMMIAVSPEHRGLQFSGAAPYEPSYFYSLAITLARITDPDPVTGESTWTLTVVYIVLEGSAIIQTATFTDSVTAICDPGGNLVIDYHAVIPLGDYIPELTLDLFAAAT